jgi:hypothetical protein
MQNGIHDNITIEDYHANTTHLSSTQIKIAKRSLKELDWHRSGKIVKPGGSHFDFGNAFELALTDMNEFARKVAIMKDGEWCKDILAKRPEISKVRSTTEYKELSEKFTTANTGKYFINDTGEESYETIESMLESCYKDKVIQGLIKNTEYQLSLFWTDEQTGLGLKTRPDICKRKKNVLVNLKTTKDGSPKAFSKDLANLDYPLQAAMEITGCIESGLMPSVDNYFWLVVEKVPPFNATVYEFSKQDIEASKDELRYLLDKISRAGKENLYPGYTDRADNEYGILTAEIPLYYRM